MSSENLFEEIQVVKNEVTSLSYVRYLAKISDQEKGFMLFDLGEIVNRYKEWKNYLPRITPFYAVKCNDNTTVLKTLAALGASFDVSSKVEIDKVLELGVSKDRLIFAHTTKINSYIRHAANLGISRMTFDNEQELYKIKKIYPSAQLVLRLRCDDETALAILGVKFGCDHKTEAPNLLKIARELNLNVIGVSFHIGSASNNPKVFYTAISYSRELFDLAKTFGYEFNFLDIGGGFLGTKNDFIEPYAKYINKGIDEFFSNDNVEIISEPGAFFVAASGTIATNIHSFRAIKELDNSGKEIVHNMYYVNDGYYGSFNAWLAHINASNSFLRVEPLYNNKNSKLIKSTVWGPTCDSRDKVTEAMLPQLNIGDWLIFPDLGDYVVRAASGFNGFPKADLYFMIQESLWKQLKDITPFHPDDFVVEKGLSLELENMKIRNNF